MTANLGLPPQPVPRHDLPWIRRGIRNRLPWVPASGPPEVCLDKAMYYLLFVFDYQEFRELDAPEWILAKVVCNLRNYYLQDQDSTVRLIQKHFNPKSDERWSEEAIRLTWELVEPFTPYLGLADVDAQSKHRVAEIEEEMTYLLAYTRSGGRVPLPDLFAQYREWYPDREVENEVLGKAVKAITGIDSKPSNGVRYYYGFHLPNPEELSDPTHTTDDPLLDEAELVSAIRNMVDDYLAREYRNRVAC